MAPDAHRTGLAIVRPKPPMIVPMKHIPSLTTLIRPLTRLLACGYRSHVCYLIHHLRLHLGYHDRNRIVVVLQLYISTALTLLPRTRSIYHSYGRVLWHTGPRQRARKEGGRREHHRNGHINFSIDINLQTAPASNTCYTDVFKPETEEGANR